METQKVQYQKSQIDRVLALMDKVKVEGLQSMQNLVAAQLLLTQFTPVREEGETDGSNKHC